MKSIFIAEFLSIGPAQRLTYQDAAWKVPQKRWMSEFQENPSMDDDWRYPHDLGTLSHHPFFLGIFHEANQLFAKKCPDFAGTPSGS